ncbi:NADH-ubiquinone oxidoreductase chain 4 [Atta colombica]|uniref:NADH:ubiquinone reductase (H(+)-translocating) n=1 Tax=Atta colombica TaxID=520822 RepID=A0A151I3N2_9HYME|nr:NADH-ubiquinone oxidoreductase chain 4 [Atta colombica]
MFDYLRSSVYRSVLAGVLLKIGRYGLIRLIEIYYKVGVKYEYIIFVFQVDIKRIVAYSSVVHINLMLCRLIIIGILGRYVMIISLGLCSSGIFYSKFIVNLYYERSGTRLLFLNKDM